MIKETHKSREQEWVELMKETHCTLPQLSRKYGINKAKMLEILPRPDLRYKDGNRTRLWEQRAVEKWMG